MRQSLLFCLFASSSAFASLPSESSIQAPDNLKWEVLSAIEEGRTLSSLDIFHPNYEHEDEKVAALAGCEPQVYDPPRPTELHVDWLCRDTKDSRFTRIYFSDRQISRLEFQPSISSMRPTAVGQSLEERTDPKAINDRFKDAVQSGEDATLGGLIPIDTSYLQYLSEMKGWIAFRDSGDRRYGRETLWMDDRSDPSVGVQTTLHFDEEGRPIGLWIRVSPMRTVLITTKRPM